MGTPNFWGLNNEIIHIMCYILRNASVDRRLYQELSMCHLLLALGGRYHFYFHVLDGSFGAQRCNRLLKSCGQ